MIRARPQALATWVTLLFLSALTGSCSYDFTVLCGNNVRDDGEECDGPGATTCSAPNSQQPTG